MREYLDSILTLIGTETLSDLEFASITLSDTTDQVAVYNSLLEVIESREGVSDTTTRLYYYFKAKGVDVNGPDAPPFSNIFVGASLE